MYYINVKSVSEVNASLLDFVTFGAVINFLHLVAIGLIYAGAGKMILKRVHAITYIENVFFAAVLLPFIAFLAQPVANAQLEAIVADPSNFHFGYRTLFNQAAGHSLPVRWGEVLIGIAYLYFAYIVYAGLTGAKQVSRWRALLTVVVGTAGMFVYQALCIFPVTQVFVHAMTRG